MNKKKKKKAVIALGVAAVVGGGAAAALWTATGTGPGQSKALTAQTVVITAATATADLYPGFTAGDVFFSMNNTNPYPITFTSMTAGTITSSNAGACPSTNVTVASATGLNLSVGANSASSAQSIADVVTMAAAAPDGCQGVTFTINLTLSGSQV